LSLTQAIELLGILAIYWIASRSGFPLAVSPRSLLMDEPLAALDLKRKQEIHPYLEYLHDALNIPVLYVSMSA